MAWEQGECDLCCPLATVSRCPPGCAWCHSPHLQPRSFRHLSHLLYFFFFFLTWDDSFYFDQTGESSRDTQPLANSHFFTQAACPGTSVPGPASLGVLMGSRSRKEGDTATGLAPMGHPGHPHPLWAANSQDSSKARRGRSGGGGMGRNL